MSEEEVVIRLHDCLGIRPGTTKAENYPEAIMESRVPREMLIKDLKELVFMTFYYGFHDVNMILLITHGRRIDEGFYGSKIRLKQGQNIFICRRLEKPEFEEFYRKKEIFLHGEGAL